MTLNSKSNEVFVRLPDEIAVRTDILEAAKLTTQLARNAENINNILKHKKKENFKLKILLSEIKSLTEAFQFEDLSYMENKEQAPVKTERDFKKESEEKIKQVKKDKLTQELEDIEKKLNSLKF